MRKTRYADVTEHFNEGGGADSHRTMRTSRDAGRTFAEFYFDILVSLTDGTVIDQ